MKLLLFGLSTMILLGFIFYVYKCIKDYKNEKDRRK